MRVQVAMQHKQIAFLQLECSPNLLLIYRLVFKWLTTKQVNLKYILEINNRKLFYSINQTSASAKCRKLTTNQQ